MPFSTYEVLKFHRSSVLQKGNVPYPQDLSPVFNFSLATHSNTAKKQTSRALKKED